ncbi:hypothetical protein JCM31826_17350 [Thermaurantimonas aggregans]|uniref:SUI1 domain-containing protein n=1 Tax=Thermaurantimonas aggregans TaxID=2173829 RepID=A0A401XMM3_9FLAO|nr:translation initiation factor [Thermaurantimonas aggregans]MCX8147708.1 translation initiation factor [Thermaurantimonas aggregans]GCD78253.1 hypothetical protein JCM31826_17350 [Thermaurantimonas aggregans]
MKKSKSKDVSEDYSFSYSTNARYNPFEALAALADSMEDGNDTNNKSVVELHYEIKGRNGKPVTIVRNLPASIDIEQTASELKKALSTGGSVKDGEIVLQGNCRKEVANWFAAKKIKTKNIGG